MCSYLLIGHWYEEQDELERRDQGVPHDPGRRRPVHVRDLLLIARHRDTTSNIIEIDRGGRDGDVTHVALVTAAALLLFGGTIGKSAQFPLHVWLPDAMAGPTPVSALIHAATMVAAGVYLVARLFEVFVDRRPDRAHDRRDRRRRSRMLIAALLALVQDDIKRVLAYSTVSQLAYMVAGLGLGPRRLHRPGSSTCSPTRSSRRCCSSARAR